MSYPIKLRVKRVNAFFGFTTLIGICCLLSSFTIVDDECLTGFFCLTKYIYRFSILVIHLLINLANSILHLSYCQHPHQLYTLDLSLKYQELRICILFGNEFFWQYLTTLAHSKFYIHRLIRIHWIHSCNYYHALFYRTITIDKR